MRLESSSPESFSRVSRGSAGRDASGVLREDAGESVVEAEFVRTPVLSGSAFAAVPRRSRRALRNISACFSNRPSASRVGTGSVTAMRSEAQKKRRAGSIPRRTVPKRAPGPLRARRLRRSPASPATRSDTGAMFSKSRRYATPDSSSMRAKSIPASVGVTESPSELKGASSSARSSIQRLSMLWVTVSSPKMCRGVRAKVLKTVPSNVPTTVAESIPGKCRGRSENQTEARNERSIRKKNDGVRREIMAAPRRPRDSIEDFAGGFPSFPDGFSRKFRGSCNSATFRFGPSCSAPSRSS